MASKEDKEFHSRMWNIQDHILTNIEAACTPSALNAGDAVDWTLALKHLHEANAMSPYFYGGVNEPEEDQGPTKEETEED